MQWIEQSYDRKKTGRPVRFELTDQARQAVDDYLKVTGKKLGEYLFARPSSIGPVNDDPSILAPSLRLGSEHRA
jgi:hypothetical protein